MSKRKSKQTNEPESLRFHTGQESVEEPEIENMFEEVIEAMGKDMDSVPPELRRQSVMFLANQLLSIAVDGDPIQIIGMLEVMKSNILTADYGDDDFGELLGLEDEGEDFGSEADDPR